MSRPKQATHDEHPVHHSPAATRGSAADHPGVAERTGWQIRALVEVLVVGKYQENTKAGKPTSTGRPSRSGEATDHILEVVR